MPDRIHQQQTVGASPQAIYDALTTTATFCEMTGAPAAIDPAEGGEFSLFGGMISGRNIECRPGRRLVQAWRARDWDEGVYSVVRFELHAHGDQTRVVLDHAGYPDGAGEHLDQGWQPNYWAPLTRLFT
jgi:activator of HSP90 ATPase